MESGIAGYSVAIVGGKLLLGCIKAKTMGVIGGAVFLVFAAHTFFFEIPKA